jgi:hypothetical protein
MEDKSVNNCVENAGCTVNTGEIDIVGRELRRREEDEICLGNINRIPIEANTMPVELQPASRLPILHEEKPVLINDVIVTSPTIGTSNGIRPVMNYLPSTQSSYTIPRSTDTTTLNRPIPISTKHPRMMSSDNTSIDLDAIDMAVTSAVIKSAEVSADDTLGQRKWCENPDSMYQISDLNRNNSSKNKIKNGMTSSLMNLYIQEKETNANGEDIIALPLQQIALPCETAGKSEHSIDVTHSSSKEKSHKDTIHISATRLPSTAQERSHRIRLGICAMDKKARSKPMAEILSRLNSDRK